MNHIPRCHEVVKTDMVQGRGCYLYDAQGRRYVDFEAGTWCTALRHGMGISTTVFDRTSSPWERGWAMAIP